jgi:hypothetical protein
MNKKGDIWISAVIYFGLGIIVITILLTAGLPVINKLRDKNVIIQTKTVMHSLDENIREVIKEVPGSQRVVTINLKKGTIDVDIDSEKVIWYMNDTKILISEPGIEVPEGKLKIITMNAPVEGQYDVSISVDYKDLANLTRPVGKPRTLIGINDLVIRNEGLEGNKIKISISETNK